MTVMLYVPISYLKSKFTRLDRIDQAAAFDDVLDELGEGRRLEGLARRHVGDDAGVDVDLDVVALRDRVRSLGAFQDVKPDVERVAVEDASKRLGDHDGYAAALDRDRRVLTRRAAAEILACDDDVALFDLLVKIGVGVFHAMLGELFGVEGRQIGRRHDDVGVDVVAEFENFSLKHISPP